MSCRPASRRHASTVHPKLCLALSLTRTTGLARAAGIDFGCDMSLRWAYIMSLTPDGAAERSGELRIGDQLVAIAGQSVIGLPVSQCMSILAAVEGAEVHRSR